MKESLDRFIQLNIINNEMACEICLDEVESKDYYQVSDIVDYMRQHGILYGINEMKIKEIVDSAKYGDFYVVATGDEVVQGADGYYTYTFNTNPNKKPRLREDGSVDYYNLNLIQCVNEGDLLAKYFEKVDGTDGKTVTGKVLFADKVKNLPPLRGKGFTTSEDLIEYYAAYDGKVELSMGCIVVSKISTIPSDVGVGVGNLDVKGDLEIMGSVLTGMKVKATGNITISGLVEAAEVVAGKNILIKGGVLGGGKARIEAGGNIFAQFVENAEIISGDCVQANSIVNSIVTAYNDINVYGKTSSIVGGSLKANHMIRTKNIGSAGQIITRVEVGVDRSVVASIKHMEIQLEEEEEELGKVKKAMELLTAKPDESREMMLLLTRTKIDIKARMQELRNTIKDTSARIELARTAEIIAEEMAHQGTIISIDGMMMKIEDDYEKIVFIRRGDKVLSKMYVEDDYDKVEERPSKLF